MRRFAAIAIAFSLLPALAWSQGKTMPNGQMPPGRPPMSGPMMGGGAGGPMGGGPMGGPMSGPMMGDDWMDGMMAMRMMGMAGMMDMMEDGDVHIDGRIAFLKAELKLSPEQSKLFEPVEKLLREQAGHAGDHPRGTMMMSMMGGRQSLPDRLAALESGLAQRLDAVRRLKTAIEPLYATLSTQQRAIADRFLLSMAL